MKKHLLGFAIFSLIVSGFVTVWAVFGYLTQPIPVVPKVESDRLPVFKSEKRKSCNMRRDKISYEVGNSYFFAEENVVISNLKLRWNGYGAPPEEVFVMTKIFSGDQQNEIYESGTYYKNVFENGNEVNLTVRTNPPLGIKPDLKNNFYADYSISTGFGDESSYKYKEKPSQVVVVHGDRSRIIKP